jgi:hypothetical protein
VLRAKRDAGKAAPVKTPAPSGRRARQAVNGGEALA